MGRPFRPTLEHNKLSTDPSLSDEHPMDFQYLHSLRSSICLATLVVNTYWEQGAVGVTTVHSHHIYSSESVQRYCIFLEAFGLLANMLVHVRSRAKDRMQQAAIQSRKSKALPCRDFDHRSGGDLMHQFSQKHALAWRNRLKAIIAQLHVMTLRRDCTG